MLSLFINLMTHKCVDKITWGLEDQIRVDHNRISDLLVVVNGVIDSKTLPWYQYQHYSYKAHLPTAAEPSLNLIVFYPCHPSSSSTPRHCYCIKPSSLRQARQTCNGVYFSKTGAWWRHNQHNATRRTQNHPSPLTQHATMHPGGQIITASIAASIRPSAPSTSIVITYLHS